VEVLQGDSFKSSADELFESLLDVPGIVLLLTYPYNGTSSSKDK
jgi:hypothetical protein